MSDRSIAVGRASVFVADADAASQRPGTAVPPGVRAQRRRRQVHAGRRLRPLGAPARRRRRADLVDARRAVRPRRRVRSGRRLGRVDSTSAADDRRPLSAVLQAA